MKKSRQTKRALIPNILAVIMCVAMLIGTTFAWFTDTASTSVNKIQAGTLDVALYYSDDAAGTGESWTKIDGTNATLNFLQTDKEGKVAQGTNILWEPGCTYSLPALKIVNEGNLALKYKVVISGINGSADLNDVIDWTITDDANASVTAENISTAEFVLTGKDDSDILTIKGHMQDTAGNTYQGKSIDGITIAVVAAQKDSEYDSNSNTYDAQATYSLAVSDSGKGDLVVTASKEGTNTDVTVAADTTITTGATSVTYPANIKLTGVTTTEANDGTVTTEVTQSLNYTSATASDATKVEVSSAQAVAQYTLELPVDTSNNTYLVTITKQFIAGLTGVKIYHSSTELPSTAGDSVREYFEYDSTTGVVTLHLFHASPIDIVYDKPGVRTVTSKDELVAAVQDTSINTVVLGDSITLSEVLDVTHNVTIDFNGQTITAEGSAINSAQRAIDVADSKLTFKDSSDAAGSFTCSYGGVKLWGESPAFELNDVTINCTTSYAVQTGYNANAATAVMNSGTIYGGAFNLNNRLWNATALNTVTINGGKIDASNASAFAGIYAGDCQILTINNGTFICDGDPTLINIGSYNPYDGLWTVNINGGDFTNNGTGWDKKFGKIISVSTKAALGLTGGTFNVKPSYVADGYQAVENADAGTWTVSAK